MSAVYRVFGQLLASDFAFRTQLLPGSGKPDLTFSLVFSAPHYRNWEQSEPVIRSSGIVSLYCSTGYDVFHFDDLADFYIFSDQIMCHLINRKYDYQVEVILLGLVFCYWLEKHGIRALHAAAVNVNGKAMVFLSNNAGGKTSLAATLTQMGYPLLTDDILPIRQTGDGFVGYPSFPQMRMWPEVAQHFLGEYEGLELAHPAYNKRRVPVSSLGDFCSEAIPLDRIFLPERGEMPEERIRLEEFAPMQAIMHLTAHSFAGKYADAAGRQAERFKSFGALVRAVPVYKMIYPSGLEALPDICQQIVKLYSRKTT